MNKEDLIIHFQNTDVDIENILKAQSIARHCLEHMSSFLRPGMTKNEIHKECRSYMDQHGSEGYWTHDDPALILFGDLSSYSAHLPPDYKNRRISENDLITIDVAPMIANGWGDMARTFVMEDGRILSWKDCHNKEIRKGMEMEMHLHELFLHTIDENTTFEQLHQIIDDELHQYGYINCDYHGNFGHSIENDQKDRVTIDKGADICISKYNKPITFEPHIRKTDGSLGFKHEDMYVFYEGRMEKI